MLLSRFWNPFWITLATAFAKPLLHLCYSWTKILSIFSFGSSMSANLKCYRRNALNKQDPQGWPHTKIWLAFWAADSCHWEPSSQTDTHWCYTELSLSLQTGAPDAVYFYALCFSCYGRSQRPTLPQFLWEINTFSFIVKTEILKLIFQSTYTQTPSQTSFFYF